MSYKYNLIRHNVNYFTSIRLKNDIERIITQLTNTK